MTDKPAGSDPPLDLDADLARNAPAERSASTPILVDFEVLARGAKELLIAYQGQQYRLRLTRNHKLILTK